MAHWWLEVSWELDFEPGLATMKALLVEVYSEQQQEQDPVVHYPRTEAELALLEAVLVRLRQSRRLPVRQVQKQLGTQHPGLLSSLRLVVVLKPRRPPELELAQSLVP
jgi:hypothetical protein